MPDSCLISLGIGGAVGPEPRERALRTAPVRIERSLRQSAPMFPDIAVRELVANALIHQDFNISGAGPTVEIFDSRIEITNPGSHLVETDRFSPKPLSETSCPFVDDPCVPGLKASQRMRPPNGGATEHSYRRGVAPMQGLSSYGIPKLAPGAGHICPTGLERYMRLPGGNASTQQRHLFDRCLTVV